MPLVDPDDDSTLRHVVRHYRYDPDRHERRHVVVAAYSTQAEFAAAFDRLHAELTQRRREDPDHDPREHISGVTLEPGHRRLQANGRLVGQMIRRNAVDPAVLAALELPSNVAVFSYDDQA